MRVAVQLRASVQLRAAVRLMAVLMLRVSVQLWISVHLRDRPSPTRCRCLGPWQGHPAVAAGLGVACMKARVLGTEAAATQGPDH